MTRLTGTQPPPDLPRLQREHDEREAVKYLEAAIKNGQAATLLADLNKLDDMLNALGMQDTDECPVDRIRAMVKHYT